MSQENVENIERAYEAMNRLDAEALVAFCEPDVEFRSRIAEVEDVTYCGHDGVRKYIANLAEVFEWVRIEVLDVIAEGDRAVVCNRFRACGRVSGVEVEERFFQALRFRDGLTWWTFYPSKAEALKAVGLAEQAMSENLDLVRSIYANWERGDFSSGSPAPASEWAHPELEYVIADGPTPGSWTGLAAMTERWRDFLSAWEDFHGEVAEFRELDDERVLAFAHFRGRGKTSGLDLGRTRAKGAHLFHVRDGKVTRLVLYLDGERALADLGLAE